MRQETRSMTLSSPRSRVPSLLAALAAALLLSACATSTPMSKAALPAACSEKPEAGMCRAAFTRYYHDEQKGECRSFIWGGCGGNVPFDTMESCQSTCQAPASEDGPVAPVKQGLSF